MVMMMMTMMIATMGLNIITRMMATIFNKGFSPGDLHQGRVKSFSRPPSLGRGLLSHFTDGTGRLHKHGGLERAKDSPGSNRRGLGN